VRFGYIKTTLCVSAKLEQTLSNSQTVGWIKMPLGTEVGLSPGHVELDGDPALLWQNGRPSQQLLSSCKSRSILKVLFHVATRTLVATKHLSFAHNLRRHTSIFLIR